MWHDSLSRLREIRFLIPGVVTLLLVIFMAGNLQLPGMSSFSPLFAAMAVYYWALCRPDLMPKWAVFLLGLFQDVLYGTPFGLTALLLLGAWGVVVTQRRVILKEPFYVIWMIFALLITGYLAVFWLGSMLYAWQWLYSPALLMQWLLTIALYPLVHGLFTTMHMAFLRPA